MENNIPEYIPERDIFGLEKKKIKVAYFEKQKDIQIPNLNVKYATLKLRILAYLLDSAILVVPSSIVQLILVLTFNLSETEYKIWDIINSMIIWTLYYGITESSKLQGTIGKLACGLIVIDEYGNKISMKRAMLRYLATIISLLPFGFGFWIIANDGKKQGWHDMLLGCYVIKKKSLKKDNSEPVTDNLVESEESLYENIYLEIKKTQKNIFGEFNKNLVDILTENCMDIEQANSLLSNYQKLYKKDLVKSICNLSSNYSTIKDYLKPFIDIGVIEEKYPHNRKINNV